MFDRLRHLFRHESEKPVTAYAALAYLVLTLLMTWPLAANLTDSFPSVGQWYGADPQVFIWWSDWLVKALRDALPLPAGFMLFWPVGISPLASYEGALMLFVTTPIIMIFGNPVLAYNIFLILAFTAAATAAFWVAFRATGSLFAAAATGFAFGFSPFMMLRGALHPNLIMIATIPLFTWAMASFAKAPTKRGAIWLGVATAANALSSWYYAVGAIIFVAIACVWHWRDLKREFRVAILGLSLAAAVTVGLALPMLLQKDIDSTPAKVDFMRHYGVSPVNLVVPHPFMNFSAGFTERVYEPLTRCSGCPNIVEASSYLGLPLLALVAYAVWRRRKIRMPQFGLWLTAAVVFLILALGLELNVGDAALPLPLSFLRRFFPFSWARVPNRFFIMAYWPATFIAAFALRDLWERCRALGSRRLPVAWIRAGLVAGLAAVLLSERLILPYPLFHATPSEFYRQMAGDRDFYAVADLPISYAYLSGFNYAQTIHGKPLVAGEFFYRGYHPGFNAFLQTNLLFASATCDRPANPRRDFTPPEKSAALAQLVTAKVRYVIVHNPLLYSLPDCRDAQRLIREFFQGERPVFTDGEITVYRVPEK